MKTITYQTFEWMVYIAAAIKAISICLVCCLPISLLAMVIGTVYGHLIGAIVMICLITPIGGFAVLAIADDCIDDTLRWFRNHFKIVD